MQRHLHQQALAAELQKAQLQCVVFELTTEVHKDGVSDHSDDAHNNPRSEPTVQFT